MLRNFTGVMVDMGNGCLISMLVQCAHSGDTQSDSVVYTRLFAQDIQAVAAELMVRVLVSSVSCGVSDGSHICVM